jgi:hypothetical protein
MKNYLLCPGLVFGLAWAASAAGDDSVKGSRVTLTGCVEASESDSFILTHVRKVSEPGAPATTTDAVLGAKGLEPGEGERIYWLSKDSVKRMREHKGHKVEVTGTVTDVSRGTVEIAREAGESDTKVEIEARGKEAEAVTTRPVDPTLAPAPRVKVDEKKSLPVHRVKVESVRMLSATCP